MAEHTKIEWTDATWNPITGCSVVSPGCTNCYAMKLAGTRLKHHPTRQGLTRDTKAGPVWNGQVRFNERQLLEPLGWKTPKMIFVCAHGDLFHESVPDAWIDKVFAVMALTPHHTYQVLTKRPERMRQYLTRSSTPQSVFYEAADHAVLHQLPVILMVSGIDDPGIRPNWPRIHLGQWPLRNVWLGTSVEDQRRADERIPHLLQTPAAIRFLSAEPLLGPIDLRAFGLDVHHHPDNKDSPQLRALVRAARQHMSGGKAIDWVIVGGESGPGARPMHPDWARTLRDQCQAAGVAFFFKQWGNWADFTGDEPKPVTTEDRIFTATGEVLGVGVMHGRHGSVDPDWREKGAAWMGRVSKKYAGRLLDGFEHSAMPEVER